MKAMARNPRDRYDSAADFWPATSSDLPLIGRLDAYAVLWSRSSVCTDDTGTTCVGVSWRCSTGLGVRSLVPRAVPTAALEQSRECLNDSPSDWSLLVRKRVCNPAWPANRSP